MGQVVKRMSDLKPPGVSHRRPHNRPPEQAEPLARLSGETARVRVAGGRAHQVVILNRREPNGAAHAGAVTAKNRSKARRVADARSLISSGP